MVIADWEITTLPLHDSVKVLSFPSYRKSTTRKRSFPNVRIHKPKIYVCRAFYYAAHYINSFGFPIDIDMLRRFSLKCENLADRKTTLREGHVRALKDVLPLFFLKKSFLRLKKRWLRVKWSEWINPNNLYLTENCRAIANQRSLSRQDRNCVSEKMTTWQKNGAGRMQIL